MEKKIAVSELRVGMHLLRLEGPWIKHPFWRARSVIDDPRMLVQVRDSGVRECWIDTSRGLDVGGAEAAPRPATPAAAPAPAPAPPPAPAPVAPAAAPATQDFESELREAAAVCNRSRRAVIAMFGEARMGRTLDDEDCLPVVEDIYQSLIRNTSALVSLSRRTTRDDY
ncbi:MAG: DUF3391 domain-containing protein, partial [Alphaproteobacteria bacterium]